MRKVETTEKITLTCDKCKAVSESRNGRYCFEYIDVQWLRLFEKVDKKYYETKHLVNRKGLDFCCQTCAKEYLAESVSRFLMELAPIADKTREEIF